MVEFKPSAHKVWFVSFYNNLALPPFLVSVSDFINARGRGPLVKIVNVVTTLNLILYLLWFKHSARLSVLQIWMIRWQQKQHSYISCIPLLTIHWSAKNGKNHNYDIVLTTTNSLYPLSNNIGNCISCQSFITTV